MKSSPRKTEERLRYYLDARQPDREGMCLALLPLLGSYTGGRPRRPKGGPDGGRDIEALFEATVIWGAVGFRNGGGNDKASRREAVAKFHGDLERMLVENPSLQGFVFFTNVDLTPKQHVQLKAHATSFGLVHVELFDFERLRHVLDSPEGMIARLQYLDIAMSRTEQLALVSRFGNELQHVVATRFDRVEHTLSKMEDFMDFQRPISRFEIYVSLTESMTSADLGSQALAIHIWGLQGKDGLSLFCRNDPDHAASASHLVLQLTTWTDDAKTKCPMSVTGHRSLESPIPDQGIAMGWVSLLRFESQSIRLIDLSLIGIEVICTTKLRSKMKRIAVDANGYELFAFAPHVDYERSDAPKFIPQRLPFEVQAHEWYTLGHESRDCLFDPPLRSGRLLPWRWTLTKKVSGSRDVPPTSQ